MECNCYSRSTIGGLFAALRNAAPSLVFGICEPKEEIVYVPPKTLWQRIKQAVTGPVTRNRVGEVDIAILGVVTPEKRRAYKDAAESVRACGVSFNFREYET